MRKTLILCLLALSSAALASCGQSPAPSAGTKAGQPTIEQRRAEAKRIRENSMRGGAARGPVTIRRSGDAKVDAYRVMMETRRRAMHGVGPRTGGGEPRIGKGGPRS
jgi:hypothetical protein